MKLIILIFMFFCHIIDDYYLQGCLANLKQKSWWEKQTSNKLYKNDYKIALLEHGFSWSFMIMLPTLIYMFYINNILIIPYVCALIINFLVHSFIDNLKANKLCINLVTDQCLHFCQILITWFVFYNFILQ